MRAFRRVAVSDEDLVRQLHSGAENALEVLFDRHYARVFVVAEAILGDSSQAEEVMQEVFLELHRNAGKLDCAHGSLKAWIVACARRRSLHLLQDLNVHGRSDAPLTALGP